MQKSFYKNFNKIVSTYTHNQIHKPSAMFVLGLQDITTPTYLHGDHESRCTVLQQLIRIGEICSYTSHDNISTDDFLMDNGIIVEDRENKKELHPPKKHLSLNLYKFNYEIGRKEYVVHGKAERRIKIIFDNHLQENVFPELENTENNVMVRKLRFTFISLLLQNYIVVEIYDLFIITI